jgi:predicted esterase
MLDRRSTFQRSLFAGVPLQRASRRRFTALAGGALASLAFGGACHEAEPRPVQRPSDDGRMRARPRSGVATTAAGTRTLGLGKDRDATLQLPSNAPHAPLPLLVLLHGAGGSGERILRRLGPVADETGVAVLAPDSRRATWDAIRGDFGEDVDFVNRALERVFDAVAVDPARVSVGGFSDGATYAVSLALINGDLFRRVLAFSPGFVVNGETHGKPRFFISHGKADPILPIDRCSRVIVSGLRRRGYEVTFREFEGGHEVPGAIAREGMDWVAAERSRL